MAPPPDDERRKIVVQNSRGFPPVIEGKVVLAVTSAVTNTFWFFRVYPDREMIEFKRACGELVSSRIETLQFSHAGRTIAHTDTPRSLGMTDYDWIVVMRKRPGRV